MKDGRGAEIGGTDWLVVFDIDGDGEIEQGTWPLEGTQFLVADLNENGIIDDGSELFGSSEGTNGVEKLRRFYRSFNPPEPNKPYIEPGDAAWGKLRSNNTADLGPPISAPMPFPSCRRFRRGHDNRRVHAARW